MLTLWILSLWKLDLHVVISGDLLNPGALRTHDGTVELLGDHALHRYLSILEDIERSVSRWKVRQRTTAVHLLTRSSIISCIRFLAASTHSFAPFRLTLSL